MPSSDTPGRRRQVGLTIAEMAIFAMLGGMMYGSRVLMAALPNIHLIGMFVTTLTVVYRRKALYPLYTYVFLEGLLSGFAPWWIPYLYIWTVLWGVVMLLPRRMPAAVTAVIYPAVSCLHGLAFSILYAPFQALFYGLDWEGTLAWIAAGLPFDISHGIGNLCSGLLILPLSALIKKLDRGLCHRGA